MVELCPVCLRAIEEEYPRYRARYKEKEYVFHTPTCRQRFLEDPEKFLIREGSQEYEQCGVSEKK